MDLNTLASRSISTLNESHVLPRALISLSFEELTMNNLDLASQEIFQNSDIVYLTIKGQTKTLKNRFGDSA